jgi:serine/threonine protein kinase
MTKRNSNTIVSLWYRAPEIILGEDQYLFGVDIWSIGCIIAELFTLEPIFKSRSDEEALKKIFSLSGPPCPKL